MRSGGDGRCSCSSGAVKHFERLVVLAEVLEQVDVLGAEVQPLQALGRARLRGLAPPEIEGDLGRSLELEGDHR